MLGEDKERDTMFHRFLVNSRILTSIFVAYFCSLCISKLTSEEGQSAVPLPDTVTCSTDGLLLFSFYFCYACVLCRIQSSILYYNILENFPRCRI